MRKKPSGTLFAACLLLITLVLAACTSQPAPAASQPSAPASGTAPAQESPAQPAAAPAAPAAPKAELPAMITMSSAAVGGGYHTVASALAAAISEHTPIRAVVQPTSGANVFLPQVDANQTQFAPVASVDSGWAYAGFAEGGFDQPHKNLRYVMSAPLLVNSGWVVRTDSGITSASQLKDKPVTSGYASTIFSKKILETSLLAHGVTWDDVKQVPVTDFSVGIRLLRSGTVVASHGAGVTTPSVVEVDQAIGIFPLPFADLKPADIQNGVPARAQELLDQNIFGTTLTVVKAGTGIVKEDTVLIAYPLTLVTNASVAPETVYTVLKALWDHYEELKPTHAWLRDLTREMFPMTNPVMPYHEGAVQFYKEVGVWTDKHQAAHNKLLAQ